MESVEQLITGVMEGCFWTVCVGVWCIYVLQNCFKIGDGANCRRYRVILKTFVMVIHYLPHNNLYRAACDPLRRSTWHLTWQWNRESQFETINHGSDSSQTFLMLFYHPSSSQRCSTNIQGATLCHGYVKTTTGLPVHDCLKDFLKIYFDFIGL